MTHTVTLLHCPFCGGDPEEHVGPTAHDGYPPIMGIYCEDCGAVGPGASSDHDEARKAWNRRVDC